MVGKRPLRLLLSPALAILLPLAVFAAAGTCAAAAAQSGQEPGDTLTTVPGDTVTTAPENREEVKKVSKPCACITMEDGSKIVLELLPDQAPLAVERFRQLVKDRFYDGLKFHRVESYLIQTGKKEHDYPPISGEMFGETVTHEPGSVGMARFPNSYDSATTQFYIMKKHKPEFNGEYTIFAQVIGGMDVVKKIKKNQKIDTVRMVE